MIQTLQGIARLACLVPDLAPSPPTGLPTQCDVFHDGQIRSQIELLINHRNPRATGVFGVFRTEWLPLEQNLASIGSMHPAEDFHQGTLSSAIFSDEGMHLSRTHMKTHLFECLGSTEALMDSAHRQSGAWLGLHGAGVQQGLLPNEGKTNQSESLFSKVILNRRVKQSLGFCLVQVGWRDHDHTGVETFLNGLPV